MPFPTPTYRVKFGGNYLPGYLQIEGVPLEKRIPSGEALNRNGGSIGRNSASLRQINLTLRVLTRLAIGSTGRAHFDDCLDQIRDAYAYLDKFNDTEKLYIGDQTRYLLAEFRSLPDSVSAGDSVQARNYDVQFLAQPYYYDDTILTDTLSGNGSLDTTFTDVRTARTYPTFQIASTVTACILTAPDGRTFTFTRGAVVGTLLVDTARLTVKHSTSGVLYPATVTEIDWGFFWAGGAGTFSVALTGYAGSGNVIMSMQPRYAR